MFRGNAPRDHNRSFGNHDILHQIAGSRIFRRAARDVQQRCILADNGVYIQTGICDHLIHDALGADENYSLDIGYMFAQLSQNPSEYRLLRIFQIQRCCGWAGACSSPGVRTDIASSGLSLGGTKKRSSLGF